MMWVYWLFTSIVAFHISCIRSHVCPKKCVCEHTKSMQCFRIQAVPTGISSDVTKLNLAYNHIKEIKGRDFIGLSDLQEVGLSSCGVELVEVNTFQAQPSLRVLDLQKNKLRHVPRGLPSSLEVLRVGHNHIHALQGAAFEGLHRLRVLDLQSNMITALRANSLSALVKLECLYLDGNLIEVVNGALRLPQLNLLSVASNRISSLSSAFFASLQSLRTLQLSGNLLTRVPHDLPRALLHLGLDRNQIRALRNRDMAHLRNLTVLSVSANKVSSVDGGLRLPNLTSLELSGNQLKVLPSRLAPKLETLDCRQNALQEVTYQHLSGMRHLKHLFLENNTIRHFEANALKNCLQLTNLALEQNLLTSIPEGLPDTLVRLDLKQNRISTIREQEMKTLKRLQVLNLRNNRLSSLSLRLVAHLPRLQRMFLGGNPWNCTCELVRVKHALMVRQVDIGEELCVEPAPTLGEHWRVSLLEQHRCEEDTVKDAEDSDPEEQTENEEYYDYDV
ncbi:hypothetical protein AALO_G00112820 [Alosa alosa]|uniref:Nephrocan-like n=1 Tax=Alosa alosa TaxID=278164 RepID=A0AAV6GPH2_9TELE|nr:nephrocan-like isoform X1 [Alosa alosa]XP_048106235.1 nephrocan-like isoform X1 [Alosa alosa]KAG5277039.1 hypothetical protein AALO_G00112820 [Alosa alosa]